MSMHRPLQRLLLVSQVTARFRAGSAIVSACACALAGVFALSNCATVPKSTTTTPTPSASPHAVRPIPVTPPVPAPSVPDPSAPAPSAPAPSIDASATALAAKHAVDDATRALFVQNCAPCHGVNGDGQGTTKLERAARSFLAGGFSYGNTPEAITRSITHGIPGTPMPSFGAALKDEQRAALAKYVISLGPPQIEVGAKETVMVVRDEPVFARGKLPPLVDGGPEIVRGLLVGTPDGLTFEYDLDDVRLVAVRTGEFADRRDWLGRGGDALQPLGTMIRNEVTRTSDPTFSLSGEGDTATPLRAVLRSTAVRDHKPVLTYDLVSMTNELVARVEETPSILQGPLGPGFVRSFEIRGTSATQVNIEVPLEMTRGEHMRIPHREPEPRSSRNPDWLMCMVVDPHPDGRRDVTGVRAYYQGALQDPVTKTLWCPDNRLAQGDVWRVQTFGLLLPKSDVPVSVEGYQWP